MQLTETLRRKIIVWYCIIFYMLMVYNWANGMFLYQLQPSFFYTRADLFTWVFMQTGLHKWLLNNHAGTILLDALFYTAPFIFFVVYKKAKQFMPIAAIAMLAINTVYIQCYSLYPSSSIEGKIAWLFFPVIFIPQNPKLFVLLFQGLRYFFLFFFASSGIWKIRQGGLFHIDQMSGILAMQHKYYLALSPNYWYTNLIYWLIKHPAISWLLYLCACLLQLSFLIGFFTIKLDKIFVTAFIVFLLMDNFIMGITYYTVAPLMLTLWFSAEAKRTQSLS